MNKVIEKGECFSKNWGLPFILYAGVLSLSENGLDDPAAELIFHSTAFPELKTLDLYNNKISDHAVDQLRNSPNFPKLTALQVDWRI